MDLNLLRIFVAVVEEGGFTAAAKRLGSSKSRVSQQLQAFEASLGTRLLHRTTRQIRLTDAGARLFERGREILAAADSAAREVSEVGSAVVGTLRVSAPSSFGRRFLAPVVSKLLRQHSALEISLNLSDRWVDLVSEGYDLAVRVGSLPESGLVARRVGETKFLLVAAPSYLKENGTPEVPEDLARHNCLRFAYQQRPDVWTFGAGTSQKTVSVRIKGSFVTNDGDLLAQAASEGAGLAWLPDFIVRDAITEQRLVPLMGERCVTVMPIHILSPHRQHRARREELFIEALVEALS